MALNASFNSCMIHMQFMCMSSLFLKQFSLIKSMSTVLLYLLNGAEICTAAP